MKSKNIKKNVETIVKKDSGITLIALVITIIVLLILVGVAINAIVGDNGVITQSKQASQKTVGANEKQALDLALNSLYTEFMSDVWMEDTTSEIEDWVTLGKLAEELEKSGYELSIDGVNKISTSDETKINPGTEIKINKTGSEDVREYKISKIENGNLVAGEGTLETTLGVTARQVEDGAGGTFYLPVGFYYVGGTVASGVVISDNGADENKYKDETNVGKDLKGNQYVWIPVDGTNITYSNHTYATANADDTSWLADTGNGAWPTYRYRNFSDWTNGHFTGTTAGKKKDGVTDKTIYNYEDETSSNIASVEKYGGFYIGRYEAGWEQVSAGTTQYTNSKSIGTSKKPSSKAGYAPWNHITQYNASLASDRLNNVTGYGNVRARLIDGVAWDTTVNYISNAVTSVIDSRPYGNYYNGTATASGIVYKYNLYRTAKEGGATDWVYNKITYLYEENEVTLTSRALSESSTDDMALVDSILDDAEVTKTTKGNYTYRLYRELVTGTAESTKVKNIYDLAGNMWEWTQENGEHENYSTGTKDLDEYQFDVRRGGSFVNSGNSSPVSYRDGNSTVINGGIYIGFRVALYIN